MKIEKYDITTFNAGNVYLKNIKYDNIPSIKAIKKIAEDKNIDVFISKNNNIKELGKEDNYLIMATKETPAKDRIFVQAHNDIKNGATYTIIKKEAPLVELSVKLYNSAMSAVETLEKKLTKK